MKGLPSIVSDESVTFPLRLPDDPIVTVDLEALVQRPFIQSLMERVMDFQTKAYGDEVRIDWQAGTFYTGVLAAHQATGELTYRTAALAWAQSAGWKIGPRPFYADDICIAQTMLDLYLIDRKPEYIKDINRVVEMYFEKKMLTADDVHSHLASEGELPMTGRNLWWWCDALYMAPPVFARMYQVTGEQRYLDLLHSLFWDTCEFLFDEKASLCYRDASFIPKDPAATLEADKIFWSRGNGWVYAGLVRVLDYLPAGDPCRPRYLELFRTLSHKLVSLQRPDGLWSSWLNRPDLAQSPEVSGTSLFTYGLLAGINRGWLEEKSYLPHALRAWRGLTCKIGIDGHLGFAQLVDSGPGPVRPESSIDYTQGTFLLAASELYTRNLTRSDLQALEPTYSIKLLMRDAAWTTSNDYSAVLADEHIYLGAVDSAGRGKILAYRIDPTNAPSIFRDSGDLGCGSSFKELNNPSLLRFEDKLLAVYSEQKSDAHWSWQVASIPKKLPPWGRPEIKWSGARKFATQAATTTQADLAQLTNENGRIYHFFSADGCDPNVTWSDDGAESWLPELRLIDSGSDTNSPHVKFADNGRDRIDMVLTKEKTNSNSQPGLYHFYYEGGTFHSSDGKILCTLDEVRNHPLTPTDGTPILNGSGKFGRDLVHKLEYDRQGQPVAIFISASGKGGDLRYWIARWDGVKSCWNSREIAHAGSPLYGSSPYEAGGITLDSENDRIVYLSSNVDPATGAPNATKRYQLFRGSCGETGESYTWEQLTFDANRDNIHPFVPRNHGREACVIWLRGNFHSRTSHQLDIYGIGF